MHCMYGCKALQWEWQAIIEGDCKSRYPAAVYSPLEQGVRPGSIPLSFFTASPLPLLISRGWREVHGQGDIYYRPVWWLCGTYTACNSWFCSLAALCWSNRGCMSALVTLRDITSHWANDGSFWQSDGDFTGPVRMIVCQNTFYVRDTFPIYWTSVLRSSAAEK